MNIDGIAEPSVCLIDFANYPFIRRFASHLNEQTTCAYIYHPGFQSPNQSQSQEHPWEHPIGIGKSFAKENLVRRWFQERSWAKQAVTQLDYIKPDIVVVSNAPLEVIRVIQRWCGRNTTPFVFWLQDIHSYAISQALHQKLRALGKPVANYYTRLERRLLKAADRIILIADDHRAALQDLGVSTDASFVLQNWSTIEDFPSPAHRGTVQEEEVQWRKHHGLLGKRIVMYSGTLGMKHNPAMLADLARACAADPEVAVVVISAGTGADWLKAEAVASNLNNLYVLPFVDYSMVPTTLDAAEVLIAILEPAAARFSVPSKILTYACVGRPVVLSMPNDNLAARLVINAGFGVVTAPGDISAFVQAVRALLEDPVTARKFGECGRAFAEENFPMEVIEKRFSRILSGLKR